MMTGTCIVFKVKGPNEIKSIYVHVSRGFREWKCAVLEFDLIIFLNT